MHKQQIHLNIPKSIIDRMGPVLAQTGENRTVYINRLIREDLARATDERTATESKQLVIAERG